MPVEAYLYNTHVGKADKSSKEITEIEELSSKIIINMLVCMYEVDTTEI
jgi:hypothetical protein